MLIENLPADSAVYRAMNDGHTWTWVEAILWQILHETKVLDQRAVWAKGKKPKWPKWRALPWKKATTEKKIGNRGTRSTADVVDYLKSLNPTVNQPKQLKQ